VLGVPLSVLGAPETGIITQAARAAALPRVMPILIACPANGIPLTSSFSSFSGLVAATSPD
jgi:hypothetical protein